MTDREARPPLRFVFPPDAEHLRALRGQLRRELRAAKVGGERADSFLLVVDEIVANAIEHGRGYRADDARVVLRVAFDGRQVVLAFEDPDVPAAVVAEIRKRLRRSSDGPPPADAERGRGLYLIADRLQGLVVRRRRSGGLLLRGTM